MNQFPNDWLTVYADHRVVFTYPKFVEAIGKYIDDIGFVDLFPEPLRLYLQMRYKEFPPSMEGDLYLQRFPPLDVQIWGQPRRVQENGSIGEIIGELKPLGTITVFCSTARELKIETVYDQFAPRAVQEVVIALGEKINACIDDANAHPKATPVKVNEANHERVSSPTILDETVSALPVYVTKVVDDFFRFNSRVPLGVEGADTWHVEIEYTGANDVNFLNVNGVWISIGARAFWQESEKEFRADLRPVTVGYVNVMPQTLEKSRVVVVCKWQSDDGFMRLFRKLAAHILEKTESKRRALEWRAQVLAAELPKRAKLMPRKLRDSLTCNADAADVVAVLFGGVGVHKMEITGAQCVGEFELHCATSLSINAPLDSDYVVFISLTMREIESMETGREELLYLLWDTEVAEIKIKQEQAGHCRMELYIDENESQWMHSPFQMRKDIPMEQDQDGYMNKSCGLPLIDGCWQILKEEWIKHETAKWDAPAPTAHAAPKNATRQDPKKPSKDAPRDEWFAYFHACKQTRIKYTLRDLATDLSLDYDYVRQLHTQYKAQHET